MRLIAQADFGEKEEGPILGDGARLEDFSLGIFTDACDEVFALVDPQIKAFIVDLAAIQHARFPRLEQGRDQGAFGALPLGQGQVPRQAVIQIKAQVRLGFTLGRRIFGPAHRQGGLDQTAIDGLQGA